MAMASPTYSSSFLLKIAFIVIILSATLLSSVHSASHHDAPSPAVDCSSLVLTMADCLSFVSNGSTVDKPEGTCCSGLKTVLKTDAECLCEAFRSSAQLGVVLNVTKAVTLPSACKVSAASAAKCALSISPAAAPEVSSSSPTSIATAPTATQVASEVAPAPAPGKDSSASSRIAVSSSALVIAFTATAGAWFVI